MVFDMGKVAHIFAHIVAHICPYLPICMVKDGQIYGQLVGLHRKLKAALSLERQNVHSDFRRHVLRLKQATILTQEHKPKVKSNMKSTWLIVCWNS